MQNLDGYSWLRTSMGRPREYSGIIWDAMDWTLAYLNIKLSKKHKNYLMNSWYRLKPYPDVKAGLQKMRKEKRSLYVFSDGTPTMLAKGLKYAGLWSFFKKVTSNFAAVQALQPNPKVYANIQQSLCNQNVVFVTGDSWTNQGAKSYGLRTIWINRDGYPEEKLGFPADKIVASFSDLVIMST